MEAKASLLGRVTDILQTLQLNLDHNSGGEVAKNLEKLYDYMLRRLMEATSQNNLAMVDEVMALLLTVKSGWDSIRTEYLQAQQKLSQVSRAPELSAANYSV